MNQKALNSKESALPVSSKYYEDMKQRWKWLWIHHGLMWAQNIAHLQVGQVGPIGRLGPLGWLRPLGTLKPIGPLGRGLHK